MTACIEIFYFSNWLYWFYPGGIKKVLCSSIFRKIYDSVNAVTLTQLAKRLCISIGNKHVNAVFESSLLTHRHNLLVFVYTFYFTEIDELSLKVRENKDKSPEIVKLVRK